MYVMIRQYSTQLHIFRVVACPSPSQHSRVRHRLHMHIPLSLTVHLTAFTNN